MNFDEHAYSYDEDLQKGLRLSGEAAGFFAHNRVRFVKAYLDSSNTTVENIVEFGSGTGNNIHHLQAAFPQSQIVGLDTSNEMVKVATTRVGNARARFATVADFTERGSFDLVFLNGVLHHIPQNQQEEGLIYVRHLLKKGGLLAVFDNNPFNLGARWVMKRIPFDRDAVMVNPYSLAKRLSRMGFGDVTTRFYFIFPRLLRVLRAVEPHLERLPIGAQ